MRKVLLGVALAGALALAACTAPPLQSSTELSFNQAPMATHAVVDEGFTAKAVYHGERLQSDYLMAAEKKSGDEKSGSDGKRGSSGSGSQVSLAPAYTLRL